MAIFEWEGITFVVGEMSRAAMLQCSRQYDALAPLYADANGLMGSNEYIELMREADALAVVNAPVALRIGGELISKGERTIERKDDLPFKLSIPLTREGFNDLPSSLAQLWITAAVTSNNWFVELLKKNLTPVLNGQKNSEPKSGSGQSNEPTTISPTTKMTG